MKEKEKISEKTKGLRFNKTEEDESDDDLDGRSVH
jgi:hypothetical protein